MLIRKGYIIMARSLYRIYLYTVFIAFLIFAAVAIERLLGTLLLLTPLRGTSLSRPDSAAIVQAVVFAIVALLISGAFGGLHYWLLRRDMRHNPDAVNSSIRAFFLNLGEAVWVLRAVFLVGFEILLPLGTSTGGSVVSGMAAATSALGVVLLLALEHRRGGVTPASGPALILQRLHFYSLQIILLIFSTIVIFLACRSFLIGLFFANQPMPQDCTGGNYCPTYNLVFLGTSMLWMCACWVMYGLLTTRDKSVRVRLPLNIAGLAYGIVFGMYGLYQLLNFALEPLFHVNVSLHDVFGLSVPHDFAAPLVLGLCVSSAYHLWLRKTALQGLIDKSIVSLTELATLTGLVAVAFWWGCGYVFYNFLQYLMPAPAAPAMSSWIQPLALLIVGLTYVPLELYLRRRSATDTSMAGPRRGLVLTLLGTGILAFASGGVIALYTCLTAFLGSPTTNWQQLAHIGLAILLVGTVLIALYLRSAIRQHGITGPAQKDAAIVASAEPTPVAEEKTIEALLDELLRGSATRDEVASNIRSLHNL